jgi:hypothetical protein
MNEMMNMVDHMTQLKVVIDETMAELMQGHEHVHDDDCCGDPECGNEEE